VAAASSKLILPRARRMYPPLGHLTPIGAYAGLRPAGRGANYVIEPSGPVPGLIHVAAIRSTGLSASLGIGEHVVGMLADRALVELGPPRRLVAPPQPSRGPRWWERAARYHGAGASPEGAT
jgi:glycerol-3-phosphate dehydrogenase